jgi:hypothetical protein
MSDTRRDRSERDGHTAKVIRLGRSANPADQAGDDLERLARDVGVTLAELVATADAYDLRVAEEVRHAAKLLNGPSIGSQANLQLINAPGGPWELTSHDGTVLGLIVAINGRLALAPVSWTRREVLAAGSAALLAPLVGRSVTAPAAPGRGTSLASDMEAAERLDYVMGHPQGVDLPTVADLRERIRSLTKQYDGAPSTSLLPVAGQCHGQVTFLREHASGDRIRQELLVVEAQSATLMGQLVWDASQRRDHTTAVAYYDQAISAANQVEETAPEAYARLRKSYVALYGEQDPQAGLILAQQVATLAGNSASHALTGLALLHVAEAHAMLGERKSCEAALGAAESHLEKVQATDPAYGLFSPDRLGRVKGSCYLFLGTAAKAQPILESTARSLHGRQKSKAIVLGNPGSRLPPPTRCGAGRDRAPQGD